MAEQGAPETVETAPETATVVTRRPAWQRIAKWIGIVLAVIALLLAGAVAMLNTSAGRAFIARQIAGFELASGLNFRVGRIDGSLFGAMVLRDVEVRDSKGAFVTSPEIAVDWRPFAFLRNHADVRSARSPLIRVLRMPALKETPSDPNAPLLPDMDIDIGRLEIGRIEIEPAVAGQRYLASLTGSAHLTGGRAQIQAAGTTIVGQGVAGGDRLTLTLDAVPDANRFDLDLRVAAPVNGLVAGLAGLEQPLTLAIGGRGDWANWNGRAVSTLGGGQLADLAITARNGRFTAKGALQPQLYMKGPVERLASPRVDVDFAADWRDRTANTKLLLRSDVFQVAAEGLIDLGESRFGNFRADAQLLRPGAIAPNLVGESVRFSVAMDGPFATPVVDYKVQAAMIGFGDMRVRQLYAEGRARVDADRILIPVNARAGRVIGLDAAGGLVDNLRIRGDIAISGDQLLSDNLRLFSDRVDATAIIAADLGTGRYTGALKGRFNQYRIDGVGVVNITTDAELYPAAGGGWGIRGHVAGTSTRLDNDAVRSFLGGNATASARASIDPDGVIRFSNLALRAPQFRILRGQGRYDPNGGFLIDADAVSTQYGPLTARVSGTVTAPEILLRAERPGLGVGLAGLEARVRGRGDAYAVTARGETDYGPFQADVLVRTGPALAVTINSGTFAGMNITGEVRQTAAGPFAGQIDFAGQGINGVARLGAEGDAQRAEVSARATNATIPGMADIVIGRALIDATVVLRDQPHVVADVQIANTRYGALVLRSARARVDYRGGSGTAQALAEGSTGVPFRVAANARMSPNRWLVALQGQGSGLNFRTDGAARIDVSDGGYRLLPTRIALDQGSLRLAGSWGDGMTVQTRLDRLDLAVLNAFVPGLGIGGTATGSLDFTQATPSSFPAADARLEIADFTRSSLAAVSTPVNVSFVGRLVPDGGSARALIRRGNTTIGRMVATLSPLGPGAGGWQERLMAAPLSGGIRYNGPSAVLFSLAGLRDQQLTGPIGVAADFSGRVRTPALTGVVRASNLTYENETYGTRLTNLSIDGRFTDDQLVLNRLAATAGEGTVAAQGSISLSAEQGFPMNITAELNDARLAASDSLGATATGRIRVVKDAEGGRIEGRLTIPEARYEVVRQGAAEVPRLTGVRRKSDRVLTAQEQAEARRVARASVFALNLSIVADNRLFISGMGLESEWGARLFVRGTSSAPRISGQATLVRGTFSFSGRRFTLGRGNISFRPDEPFNPSIDIVATTTAEGVTAILNVGGTAEQPRITFTSTPTLPQDEVIARLLFGSSVTDLSATEAIQLAAALNSLRGSGGGLNPLGKLRSAVGIDRLRILGADDTTGRGTALSAGKYITDDIYVEIITDARGFTATQLEIALSRALSVLSQTGSFGGSSVSIRYSRDY